MLFRIAPNTRDSWARVQKEALMPYILMFKLLIEPTNHQITSNTLCSISLLWQIYLHNNLEGQVQILNSQILGVMPQNAEVQ